MQSVLKPSPEHVFESGKVYTHAQGLSCCFRQWRAAHSHCRFLHGYALQVTITFGTNRLDGCNWVVDFGGLKPVKKWLEDTFDHKTLVAKDDPMLHKIQSLAECPGMHGDENKLADVIVVDHVGCEAFAKMIFDTVDHWLNLIDRPDVVETYEQPKTPGHLVVANAITAEKILPTRPFVVSVKVEEHAGNFAIYRRDPASRTSTQHL